MNRPFPTDPIHFCMDHPERPAVVTFHGQVPPDAKVNAGLWTHENCCAECADKSISCWGCGVLIGFAVEREAGGSGICPACGMDLDHTEVRLAPFRPRLVPEKTP